MNQVADSLIKEANERSSRTGTRYLFRYDKNFLPKVDAEYDVVQNYGLAAAKALEGDNPIEYAQRLKHFKLALKVHLKRISAKLYVSIRNEFAHDVRAPEIKAFEARTTRKLGSIGSFLTKAKSIDWEERETLRTEFLAMLSDLNKLYEQERDYLHPIYLELDDSVIRLSSKRKTSI